MALQKGQKCRKFVTVITNRRGDNNSKSAYKNPIVVPIVRELSDLHPGLLTLKTSQVYEDMIPLA